VHETGHGRYEQNRPRDWLGQPLSLARSAAIHESQSLSFEMQIGCHPGFVARLAPMLVEAFGEQPAFAPANLQRLLTRVKPSFIRVDADEVTYPAHVILRYEIERPLIEGSIQADARQPPRRRAAGRALALGLVRLLSLLFAGCDVCRAVVCHAAPNAARPGPAHRRRRPGAHLQLAAEQHLERRQPLDNG
jgi:Carboxypeptidase Taq (M32) metallopeptidase